MTWPLRRSDDARTGGPAMVGAELWSKPLYS
jgi:hypothetical protein